jgi:hypothetical protein
MFLPFPYQMAKLQLLTGQQKTIRRRFAMARQEKQRHVATCCRCVASRKAQRNPCKMRLVAVLPIFRTCISILPFLPFFAANQSFDGYDSGFNGLLKLITRVLGDERSVLPVTG